MKKVKNDTSLEDIIRYVNEEYPEYCVVKRNDYESSSKQSYKFLYEKSLSELKNCENKLAILDVNYQKLDSELTELQASSESYYSAGTDLNVDREVLVNFIQKFLKQGIVVSDVNIADKNNKNDVGEKKTDNQFFYDSMDNAFPGVYGFKRSSWFTLLQNELTRENLVKKEEVENSLFWRKRLIFNKKVLSHNFLKEFADYYDEERKKNIAQLLLSSDSNQSKYMKYIIVTPGLSKEVTNLLYSAMDIGANANIVIELLEQPAESFNIDVLERYIHSLKRNSDYHLKMELANELIRGDWFIRAKVNGEEKVFQLVPFEDLKKISDSLQSFSDSFKNNGYVSDDNHSNDFVFSETGYEDDVTDEDKYPYIFDNDDGSNEYTDESLFDASSFDDSEI